MVHEVSRTGSWGRWASGLLTAHLKSEERHDDGHPAQGHGDVRPPLLCDHIHGAQEQDGPYDVVKDDQAQEGHENPQGDTHHLSGKHRSTVC